MKEHGDEQKARDIYGSHGTCRSDFSFFEKSKPLIEQILGDLPVARAATLKHILRSLHRMMQSSGASEGLRGLIDTSILKSIMKILEYRGLFGPTVLPIGKRSRRPKFV